MALESIAGTALNIALMILSVLLVIGLIAAVFWFVKSRQKFKEFKVIIWERDGFGQLKETTDEAGIFVDNKTKNKRLFLRKNNVGLNPDGVPYIQSGKSKMVYLYRTGLKNFHYLKINVEKEPGVKLTVGEEDVNWGINAYDRAKKMFSTSLLMQMMPFIMLAFVSLIILVLFIFLFRQFGDLAAFMEAAEKFISTANAAQGGTAVIPS